MPNITAEERAQFTEYNSQLKHAAARGGIEGLLAGTVSGVLINYRYNHPPWGRFFKNTYKVWWLVVWTLGGVAVATDNAKIDIRKQAGLQREIRRNAYLDSLYGDSK